MFSQVFSIWFRNGGNGGPAPEAKMGAIPLLIDVVNDTDHVAPAARRLSPHPAGWRVVELEHWNW